MVKPISYISYGENEKKIIKAGIVEIRKVLMGNDKNKKRITPWSYPLKI